MDDKEVRKIPKHYVYRMDYDTGFAPNTEHGICTLSGCKKSTIERWAEKGSWVIGIGGDNTGKPDRLIYAMKVEKKIPYAAFKKDFPRKSEYLNRQKAGDNVLMSKNFYYFGDNAIALPSKLSHVIIDRQGCKCVDDVDVRKLRRHLERSYEAGVLGKPNNAGREVSSGKRC